MIPFTFPTVLSHNRQQCVTYALSSVTGLTEWIDYIPVKATTNPNSLTNSYAIGGNQFIFELASTSGLQAGKDYINIYYDATKTVPFSTNTNGYIPVWAGSYGYNMSVAGDSFSTPNAVANQITGDLTLIVEAALTDWTPTVANVLLAKDGVSAGTRSYQLAVLSTGVLQFSVSLNGSTLTTVSSSVAPSFIDGKRYHIAVERVAATGAVKFYTSPDHITWTQLGTTQSTTAGNIYAGTAQVEFGNLAALSYALVGKIYDSEGYAGLAITSPLSAVIKFDFDPYDWISGTTFTSKETGEVWTLNGNALISK